MYFQLKPNVTCILMGFIYPIKVPTVMNASDREICNDLYSVCIRKIERKNDRPCCKGVFKLIFLN